MKKIINLIMIFVLLVSFAFGLSSCGKEEEQTEKDDVVIRVGSLKGPTSIGLLNLMSSAEQGNTTQKYQFTMETQGSTLSAMMVQKSLDIALVPANLAANLYNKTNGNIVVLNINTLGVLYCVTGDTGIESMSDLAGKQIITTGQGSTPEFAIKYLMSKLNITDYSLEFKGEATEVAAILKNDPTKVAILPQPFVTVATKQNSDLKVAFSLNDEWNNVASGESSLVTGVTIVRKDFFQEHETAVLNFMADHAQSVSKVLEDIDTTASLMVSNGIIANEVIAKAAIPFCNVVSISGADMKTKLSGYLKTLFDLAPLSIGGAMPADDFYLVK